MKKQDLVAEFNRYAREGRDGWKGQQTLARWFAYYFHRLEIPSNDEYDHWQIDSHIAQLLVAAMEEFRTSEDPLTKKAREDYELVVDWPMPDLMDITGDGLNQALAVQSLGFLFNDIFGGERIGREIDLVFNARRHLLQQSIYTFVAKVYSKGLAKLITDTQERGISGVFGETTIRTYYLAGRQLITLARPAANEGEAEDSLTLICGEDDPLALGIGTQSVYADLQTALAMLEDVIANWPDTLEDAWMMIAPDDRIGII